MRRMVRDKKKLHAAKMRGNRKQSSKMIRKAKRLDLKYPATRKNPKGNCSQRRFIFVQAPEGIDLYSKKQHTKTMLFVNRLKAAAKQASEQKRPIKLCFRHTNRISATGGIYLYAITDSLIAMYPNIEFTVIHPPKKPNHVSHENLSVVQAVLKRINYYKLIGAKAPKVKELPHVDCWVTAQAEKVDSDLLGGAIQKLGQYGIDTSDLFRSGIEAMSNASEHAYDTELQTHRVFPKKHWWLFTAILEKRLIVYICDLGHGIPVTMPHKHKESVLRKIRDKITDGLGSLSNSSSLLTGDVFQIQASTLVKETRTELGHRGKGGGDIRCFIDNNKKGQLVILSNKGIFKYKATSRKQGLGMGLNAKHSIDGTIVGWTVPINEEI